MFPWWETRSYWPTTYSSTVLQSLVKTIQVSDATHRALMERKLDGDLPSLDAVIAVALGIGGRRERLARAGPALDEVCRRHRVLRLRVFGSARVEADGAASDLDLIVDFRPGARPGLFGLAQLGEDLEDLLATRVDVTTEAGLHPRMAQQVTAEAEEVWHA